MTNPTEDLTKALHSANFLRDELRHAHEKSTAVESLILLSMIQRATELERDINALISARTSDNP